MGPRSKNGMGRHETDTLGRDAGPATRAGDGVFGASPRPRLRDAGRQLRAGIRIGVEQRLLGPLPPLFVPSPRWPAGQLRPVFRLLPVRAVRPLDGRSALHRTADIVARRRYRGDGPFATQRNFRRRLRRLRWRTPQSVRNVQQRPHVGVVFTGHLEEHRPPDQPLAPPGKRRLLDMPLRSSTGRTNPSGELVGNRTVRGSGGRDFGAAKTTGSGGKGSADPHVR